MALKQPRSDKTYITEVKDDGDGNPIPLHQISAPPVHSNIHDVFNMKDVRALVHRLARLDDFEHLRRRLPRVGSEQL